MTTKQLERLSDTIFINLKTREIFDKELSYGAEAITQEDVDRSIKLAEDLDIKPPKFVNVFNKVKESKGIVDLNILKAYC